MVNPNIRPKMGLFQIGNVLDRKSPGLPNINWKQLTKFCRMKINSFDQYGQRVDTTDGPFFYKDNGSDILAIAHLDYVMGPIHTSFLKLSDDTLFFCPTLDDRAGVYAILDYLPSKGLKYDVLLTTNEEKVGSTASHFKPPKGKKYRYMFSFDRRGTDVVMYNYYNYDMAEKLKILGWKVDFGTYSDISELEHLRCKGFNFGVGYDAAHTARCHLSHNDFKLNMRRFLSFYNKYRNDWFPHTPQYNSYTKDEGFGYLYTNVGQSRNMFTDEDIEIIEILEKENYDFSSRRITPLSIKELIKEYQGGMETKTSMNKETNKAIQDNQIKINFDEPKNKPIIRKLPLQSEDNPDYLQPRKVDVQPNRDELHTVAALHFVVNDEETQAMGECSQCHQPTSFNLGTNKTLCKDCQAANAVTLPKPKARIVTKLTLHKPGVKDAAYEYIEDKEGGKGWIWAARYPSEKLETIAA